MDKNTLKSVFESIISNVKIFRITSFKIILLISIPFSTIFDTIKNYIFSSEKRIIAFAIIYLIGIFILDIFNQVFVELWKRFKPLIVNAIADYIEISLNEKLSKFYKKYKQSLIACNQLYSVQGMTVQGSFSLELKKVFVELDIIENKTGNTLRKQFTEATKRNIWDLLKKKEPGFRTIVIIGKPGSGKTTILQHLTLRIASKKAPGQLKHFIPFFLPFRKYINDIIDPDEDTPSLADILKKANQDLEPPNNWFHNKLKKNGHRCLVMLDGLDEVADQEKRELVVKWFEQQANTYFKTRFIITSRPHGYYNNKIYNATILELSDYSREQIFEFVQKWYKETEIAATNLPQDEVSLVAKRNAQDLLQRIFRSEILSKLAINPLLLTMITNVHRYIGELPERRAALYQDICKVLLTRRQNLEIKGVNLGIFQKQSVLQVLALAMMIEGKREIALKDAIYRLIPILELVGINKETAVKFFRSLMNETGLLVETEINKIAFAHLTYQEYLAAAEIKDDDILLNKVGESWWDETILLYAAMSDATKIVLKCLEPPKSLEKLKLAYEISQEAMKMTPAARKRLENELLLELESNQDEKRLLAADLILEIRLKKMIRVKDNLEIDPFFISQAEYQSFIDDTSYRPDHWNGWKFLPGNSLTPITGIRYEDANYYAIWLTKRAHYLGHRNLKFRLLTKEEVAQVLIPDNEEDKNFKKLADKRLGTWLSGGEKFVFGEKAFMTSSMIQYLQRKGQQEILSLKESNPTLYYKIDLLVKEIEDFLKKIEITEKLLKNQNQELSIRQLSGQVDEFLDNINEIKAIYKEFELMAQKRGYYLNLDKNIIINIESTLIDLRRLQFSRSGVESFQVADVNKIITLLHSVRNDFNFLKTSLFNYEGELDQHHRKIIEDLENEFKIIIQEPIDTSGNLKILNDAKIAELSKTNIELVLKREIGKGIKKAQNEVIAFAEYYLYKNQTAQYKNAIKSFWGLFILDLRSKKENPLPAFEGIRLAVDITKND